MDTATENLSMAMSEADWQIAHAIAQTLVKQETDVNEVGKAIAYLRNAVNQNQTDAGSRFFKYLKTLLHNGRTIGHSGRTSDYYRNIEKACSGYLLAYQTKPATMLNILGWTARLIRYYREGGAIGEILTPSEIITSQPQTQVTLYAKYQLNQVVDATVVDVITKKVDAKKTKTTVTYALDGEKLPKAEEIYNIEKKGISLKPNDLVKLKIVEISNDSIKKFERL